ncbi:MAG: preprotein translocase subunit SecA [Thermaerobacter sp.]|nr:preprotein translocase subunit SecA [Thermaerobacter sp.]
MLGFIKNLFDSNAREIKRLEKVVADINSLEPKFVALSDTALRAKTEEFRARLQGGATLDSLLPEAFAAVREASRRVIGQRHFDVQLLGGMVLHQGRIAEMKTGEGKTLVATLPAYLNALQGKGVHVITVNDYLARLHSEWMGQIYHFLGLEVGLIVHGIDFAARKRAYAADITYGTNNEFGFDYLRDNMVHDPAHMVQRELHHAIVDEVDSILIDEARTPLIISGQGEQSTDLYHRFARLVRTFREDLDYTVDEKMKTVTPTEVAVHKTEKAFGVENLFDNNNISLQHHLNQAIRAKALMKLDRDYVVKDDEVIIVDEFTGRLMYGRRYSAGLHQAIEAKEGVTIEKESQTLASITFQNYFRMYTKLSGMTGTAVTEEEEFRHIYKMDVVVLPTNRPMIRKDMADVVYKTEKAKYNAVIEDIIARHATGQPVLVGTVSIEKSEWLSEMLKKRRITHQVLNAKHHEREAEIVAQGGRKGTVTIATNMAGRGTDIILGGNAEFLTRQALIAAGVAPEALVDLFLRQDPESLALRERYLSDLAARQTMTQAEHEEVVRLGGLHIIGTERHEARRIDNQLRGRAGRQGDPGSSQFFISLEDDLMRLFGGETMLNLMDKLGMEDDMPIEHSLLSGAIERAQKRVESRNFDLRKHVLEYDDVLNKQRTIIYRQRREALSGQLDGVVEAMFGEIIDMALVAYIPDKTYPEEWDVTGLQAAMEEFVPLGELDPETWRQFTRHGLRDEINELCLAALARRQSEVGAELFNDLKRVVLLRMVDTKWMSHLDNMEELRQGIGLRAYGQKDPLVEYKLESYEMFQQMIAEIKQDVVRYVFRVQVVGEPQAAPVVKVRPTASPAPQAAPRDSKLLGRNDPCPCGSGKKYKKCCGRES